MRGGYRSRHSKPSGSSPPSSKYSTSTWVEYSQTPLQHDQQDADRLRSLQERGPKNWSQEDSELHDEISQRNEEREDVKRAPLRRELEGYFDELGLASLPPPMAKSSLWLEIQRPCNYDNEQVRPFYVACENGELKQVREWVRDKRDMLGHVGLQDGLACAAKGNQVEIASYLLAECGATLHGAVIQAACTNLSLPLFQLCIRHGYHPNQQVPSLDGHFGTALIHCIDNEAIVRFLLQHGADPNLAPFHDNRKLNWGLRATPPMDRTSGLALDLAVKKGNTSVVEMLLENGADARYSRPIHGLIALWSATSAGVDARKDGRPLMEKLLRHGADVNATTYSGGTPLHRAIVTKMWDVVEFLLEKGADPRRPQPATALDAFAVASREAGTSWEKTEGMDGFLTWLCDTDSNSNSGSVPPAVEGARENPLVRLLAMMHGKDIEDH